MEDVNFFYFGFLWGKVLQDLSSFYKSGNDIVSTNIQQLVFYNLRVSKLWNIEQFFQLQSFETLKQLTSQVIFHNGLSQSTFCS
jgi:hypothetical protein